MVGDAGGSNPSPIGLAFPAEKGEEAAAEESWINSCLALDESNTAAASSADSNPQPLPDTFHGDWAPLPSEYFSEPDQQELETSPVKRELSQENGGSGFRPLDLADDEENPGVSLDPATEDDVANIFRVWDLNTEDPELEKGTLTDILKESLAQALESPSVDGKTEELVESVRASLPPGPSDDGLDLRELEKELQEPESVERLIAAMADLNLYVNWQNGG